MKRALIIIIAVVILIAATVLVLFFSPHKITVTSDMLKEALEPISELSTSAFTYSGKDTQSNARTGLGLVIPGTTNSVTISYSGVINVGYDVSAIQEKLDDEEKIIYVCLPQAEIFGNYIDTQTLVLESNNNILNPIDVEAPLEYLKQIQEKELDRAIAAGMYDTAESQMRSLITGLLAVFEDYTVQFVSETEFDALDIASADGERAAEAPEATEAAEPADAPEATDAPEAEDAPETTAAEDAPADEQTQEPAA